MNPARTQVRSLARPVARDLRRGLKLAENLRRGLADDPHPKPGRDRCLAAADSLVSEITKALHTLGSLARGHCDDHRLGVLDDSLGRAAGVVFTLGASLATNFGTEKDPGRARLLDLGEVLTVVDGRVADLVRGAQTSAAPAAVRWSAVCRRLTAFAARILPATDRPEYDELFHSELCDLAQSGSGRWAQLLYAIRVLVRAPLLRWELRAPARERSR